MSVYRAFAFLLGLFFLVACDSKNEDKKLSMNQAAVIEVVTYQTKVGIKDAEHLKKASAITPILAKFDGFITRQFGKSTNGKWVELVYWKDLSAAQKAADAALTIPECQAFFADIDQQKMDFMHSVVQHQYP
jgi:hypothetical protein